MTEENIKDKSVIEQNTELIKSEAFENALTEAANVQKDVIALCKERNKNNYGHFYDVVLTSRKDIQDILDIKKRNRSDDDNQKIKNFRKETSQMYKQICDFITPEELEEGEETKIQKTVKRIASVIKMMNYIGHTEIEDEFKKYGIEMKYESLNDDDVFSNENIKKDVEMVFTQGKTIREDMEKSKNTIKVDIYSSSVPTDLQYDKDSNPTGIKDSDFLKLVDFKTKMIIAGEDEEAKEKISDKASTMAGDYEFANVRNKIMQSKLMDII